MQPRMVVALHDVAPSTLTEVRSQLAALDGVGVRPRVLKVIPNAQGRWPLAASPPLISLLRGEIEQGSEVVLHGYTHQALGKLRGPWPARLRGRLFAAAVAEFLSIDTSEMRYRVEAGRAVLEAAGLPSRGFCPPGWLAPRQLDGVLRDFGFSYRVDLLSVLDLARQRRLRTPWIGYMGADQLQEGLVGIANALTGQMERRMPLIKVFIHPARPSTAAAYNKVMQTIRALAERRELVTYGQLLA